MIDPRFDQFPMGLRGQLIKKRNLAHLVKRGATLSGNMSQMDCGGGGRRMRAAVTMIDDFQGSFIAAAIRLRGLIIVTVRILLAHRAGEFLTDIFESTPIEQKKDSNSQHQGTEDP